MASDFSTVDVLTMAASAAGSLRSSGDPEAALANVYAALGLDPPQTSEPLSVRIVRLVLDAGDDRQRLNDYLRRISGPLPWQRPPTPPDQQVELVSEDPEAKRLVEIWQNEQLGPGYSLFYRDQEDKSFPSFRLLERAPVQWFYGPTIIRRDGQEIPAHEAGPPQDGDEVLYWKQGLPTKVRALIEYPFEIATVFEIETEEDVWDVWEICCAFADQYHKLFESPEQYGIWGHDLSELWIEDLLYYPDHQLIYPSIGS